MRSSRARRFVLRCLDPVLKQHACKTLFANGRNNAAICGTESSYAIPLFQRGLPHNPGLGVALGESGIYAKITWMLSVDRR